MNVLFDREPWAEASVALFDRVESGGLIGHLGATTVTAIHYIACRNVGAGVADALMRDLLRLFDVASVNRAVLEGALALGFADFEEAVLHEAGRLVGARAIVTRDPSGFSAAALRIYDPETLVAALETSEES